MDSQTHTTFALLVFLLILSLSSSSSSSAPVSHNFLECFSSNSPPSIPISQVVYARSSNHSLFDSLLESTAQNLRFLTPNTPKPHFIITPLLDSHVQAAVICCKRYGYQIKTRSGGHDFEGLSFTSDVQPFVVLDLVKMKAIHLNIQDSSAWIQTGVTNGELLYQLGITSPIHAFPTGTYPSVGVGGLISGGGMGVLLRKYGLSSDNILDARIVDATGRILDKQTMGEDLFWALRGGGGGNFGVIVAWKLKLLPIPAKVSLMVIPRTIAQGANKLFFKWQRISSKFPNDVFMRASVTNVAGEAEGSRTVRIQFIALYLGRPRQLFQMMNDRFPELGVELTDCLQMSFAQAHLRLNNFPLDTPIEALARRMTTPKTYTKSKSDFVRHPISEAALDGLWEMYLEHRNTLLLIDAFGGKMSSISESETPFPHRRGNLYSIMYFVMWANNSDSNRQLSLMQSLYSYMTPYVSKSPRSAYVNNRDLDIGRNTRNGISYSGSSVWGTKCFKNNFRRLALVKGAVDPTNFFMNEQSIPPVVRRRHVICNLAGFACPHTSLWSQLLDTLSKMLGGVISTLITYSYAV